MFLISYCNCQANGTAQEFIDFFDAEYDYPEVMPYTNYSFDDSNPYYQKQLLLLQEDQVDENFFRREKEVEIEIIREDHFQIIT